MRLPCLHTTFNRPSWAPSPPTSSQVDSHPPSPSLNNPCRGAPCGRPPLQPSTRLIPTHQPLPREHLQHRPLRAPSPPAKPQVDSHLPTLSPRTPVGAPLVDALPASQAPNRFPPSNPFPAITCRGAPSGHPPSQPRPKSIPTLQPLPPHTLVGVPRFAITLY